MADVAGSGVLESVGDCCIVCGKESTSRCSSCRLVFYCSKQHQKTHWKEHKPHCTKPKFKISQDDRVGRHIVTTELCKPDTILLKDRPLILGPKIGVSTEVENGSLVYCLGCYKEMEEVDQDQEPQCDLCGLPVCSALCSQQHFHRDFECRFFREGKARVLEGLVSPNGLAEPNAHVQNTVSVLQSLLYFRSLLLKLYFPHKWTELSGLEANNSSRQDMPHLEKTTRVFEEFKKVFGGFGAAADLSKPDLHRVIGIVSTNSLEFKVWSNFELLALFPQFSLLEHSCCPNTKVYLVPRPTKPFAYDLFLRSSVRIPPASHLTTSYTNLLWNTEKRREELRRVRFFWCVCPRCLDPTELNTHFSTIICPMPDCKAYAVPVPKPSPAPHTDIYWQCMDPNCAKTCESWQVKKVDSRLAEMVAGLKPTVGKYKELQAKMEALVHPNYYLNFVLNHSLVQMFGQDSRTRNDKEVLDEKIQLINRLLSVVKLLDPGLGSLHVYTAVLYYEMQSAILALCGAEGEDDFGILRSNTESVKLAKMYLLKCIACFQYELLDRAENKLKLLASNKMDYLNMVLAHPNK